jgi:hypothetical protein
MLVFIRYVLPVLVFAAAIGLVIMLCCTGCGTMPELATGDSYRQIAGDARQASLAADVAALMREHVPVDVSRVDLMFVTTAEEQREACDGFAACTHAEVNGYHVATYWPDPGAQNHAQLLAHELCHVYYYETGEAGDPNHTHVECFESYAHEVAQQF